MKRDYMYENKFVLFRNGSGWDIIGESKKKGKVFSKWSELCPDLLRCVFKRLSFTSLSRAKSVCSSWHYASKGCVPKQNQIPWLILFPRNNNNSCGFFVPDDRDNVYKSRDLGAGFAESRCLNTCGSWLLMSNFLCNLYILNPFTGEMIDLPHTSLKFGPHTSHYLRGKPNAYRACFWIDNKTKDYLVIWIIRVMSTAYVTMSIVYTRNGDNKWHVLSVDKWYTNFLYNHKDHKLYLHGSVHRVEIWDFSGDDKPHIHGYLDPFKFNHYDVLSCLSKQDQKLYWERLLGQKTRIAVTDSGDVLMVGCIILSCNTCYFRIYKTDQLTGKWVQMDSLGDEALICDKDSTVVVAKDIPGIKRNSIYFSGLESLILLDHQYEMDPYQIFVFDLATQKMEPLPQCVFSNTIYFSDARWFFPS